MLEYSYYRFNCNNIKLFVSVVILRLVMFAFIGCVRLCCFVAFQVWVWRYGDFWCWCVLWGCLHSYLSGSC